VRVSPSSPYAPIGSMSAMTGSGNVRDSPLGPAR
jgi:hypothetical protein